MSYSFPDPIVISKYLALSIYFLQLLLGRAGVCIRSCKHSEKWDLCSTHKDYQANALLKDLLFQ